MRVVFRRPEVKTSQQGDSTLSLRVKYGSNTFLWLFVSKTRLLRGAGLQKVSVVNASHLRGMLDSVAAALHPPGCHPVQPEALQLPHQVQAEDVPLPVSVRRPTPGFVFEGGAWRFGAAAVNVAVTRVRTG